MIKASKTVMGKNGLNAILNLGWPEHFNIDNYPPDIWKSRSTLPTFLRLISLWKRCMVLAVGWFGLAPPAVLFFADSLKNFGRLWPAQATWPLQVF